MTVLENVHNCGSSSVEFVSWNGGFFDMPKYCDNRVCDNPECQRHRGNLHVRNHRAQVEYLKKYIDSPKSFVFTGWRFDYTGDDWRVFARSELVRLFVLLFRYCKTAFVIFMEFKLKEDGSYYLHFHVVAGSVGDIRFMESLWGRKVRYEYPVKDDDSLFGYIRKYTSKTPYFVDEFAQLKYLQVVYKLQMARYSPARKSCENEFPFIRGLPSCYVVSLLVSEMNSALRRRENHEFVPYLDRPPDVDVPSCVYVFPHAVRVPRSSKRGWNTRLEDYL